MFEKNHSLTFSRSSQFVHHPWRCAISIFFRVNPVAFYYWCQGLFFLRLNAGKKAIKCFDHAIRLSSGFAQAYKNRADGKYLVGWLGGAYKDYRQAKRISPSIYLPSYISLYHVGLVVYQ